MDNASPSPEHTKILNEVFKLKSFKKEQWNVIRTLMYEKRNATIVASTGFGKSLIYQFPPIFLHKIALIISPLISLMQDQTLSLQARGIRANYWSSAQQDKSVINRLYQYSIIYVTPETFENNVYKQKILNIKNMICLIAVDEAHCIFAWRDFRPSFTKLGIVKELFPDTPIITLTATAPMYVQKIINDTLTLDGQQLEIRTALNRNNLSFSVYPKRYVMTDLLPYLKDATGASIIYVLRRQEAEDITKTLRSHGINCEFYHSEVHNNKKDKIVKDFRSKKLDIIVATIAFGMGIDRGDVRLVIHYGFPRSLEGYYQEAGRAGRDGEPSKCILFYGVDDRATHERLIQHPNHDENKGVKVPIEIKNQQMELVARVVKFLSSKKCRRYEVLEYLGAYEEELAKLTIEESCCDNCVKSLLNGISPKLRYEGIEIDGTVLVTKELRLLLSAIHRKLPIHDVVALLVGKIPTNSFKFYNMKYFSAGHEHPENWWLSFFLLTSINGYIRGERNQFSITKRAKSFLRQKTEQVWLPPTEEMLKHMKKRNDLIYYWKGNSIHTRPKILDIQKDETETDVHDLQRQNTHPIQNDRQIFNNLKFETKSLSFNEQQEIHELQFLDQLFDDTSMEITQDNKYNATIDADTSSKRKFEEIGECSKSKKTCRIEHI